MRILCYEHSGFCSGVRRAVGIALNLAKEDENVFTLGPLVHNEEVEKYLSSKGVQMVSNPDDAVEGNLIIRTHGEGPDVFQKLSEKSDLKMHDATCPRVNKVQKLANELTVDGYQVIVWGKPDHPEVRSIVKWTGDKAIVVSSIPELTKLNIRAPAAMISQTTQERSAFEAAARRFKSQIKNSKVYDTLCPTVKRLQDAAEKMASRVDLMIIIGSPLSSNTEKLLRLCIRKTPTIRVSGAEEIKDDLFRDINVVGVIAGASTPDWIIKEVLRKMDEFKNEEINETSETEKGLEKETQIETIADTPEANEDETVKEIDPQAETETEKQKEEAEPEIPSEENKQEVEKEETEITEPPEEERKTLEEIKAELKEEMKNAEPKPPEESSFYFIDEIKTFQVDDVANGSVVKVDEDGIMVDLGDKTEAFLPPGEVFLKDGESLQDKFTAGDPIEVLVIKVNDQEGELEVSHRRLDRKKTWETVEKAFHEETIFTGIVKNVVKAGMTVALGAGIEAFMPGSLIDVRYVPDLKKFLGEEISFKIIEINPEKEKVIVSRKKCIEEINEVKKKETFETLKVGDVIKGIVRRLTKFGAFVDVGGVDGLVHISELSWGRIKRPEEVLTVNDEIKVKVIQVLPEEGKISLSYRSTQSDPWDKVTKKFKIGQITKGTVTRLAKFGAFIEIMPGVEGLSHISQVAEHHVKHPSEVLKEGAEVDVKILDLRPEDKRISLSIKDAAAKIVDSSSSQNNESDNGSGVTLGDVFGDLFEKDSAAKEASAEPSANSEPEQGTEAQPVIEPQAVSEEEKETEAEATPEEPVATPEEPEATPEEAEVTPEEPVAAPEEPEATPEEPEPVLSVETNEPEADKEQEEVITESEGNEETSVKEDEPAEEDEPTEVKEDEPSETEKEE